MKVNNYIEKTQWVEFVKTHPNGNIFQTPEIYEVYLNTKNYEPIFLAVENGKKEILGVLLAVIQKEHSGFLGKFSSRAIIYGGPLVLNDDPKILDFILTQFNHLIKNKVIYSQFRNFWLQKHERKVFEKLGFHYEEHLNILVDLTKTEEELWSNIHPKRRNEIRRAIKEGTTFKICIDIDSLNKCYEILILVYKRAKLPLPNYDYFYKLYSISTPESGIRIFTAQFEDKIIGCMLTLVYGKVVYDYYAGANYQYYNQYPNDLIPWEVMKYAKKAGYSIFDFGGAGKPGVPYGVRDYKKKFGGEIVNFGRYNLIYNKPLYKLGKFGLKLIQPLKT